MEEAQLDHVGDDAPAVNHSRVFAAALLFLTSPALAQLSPPAPASALTAPGGTAAPPAAPTPFGSVAYGAVDAATVRVFAVGDVKTEQVQGRFQSRTIAIPETGHGSGVVIDPRGVIVTAAHVVEGAHHVAVRLPGVSSALPAIVVSRDDTLDFAILLVLSDTSLSHVLTLPEAPPALTVRQTVDAIGYPLDATREQPQSTRGIISASLDDGRLQLGISVNPGNSGGPLVDERENLVGIIVARGDPSRGVQGIGLAVPVAPIRAAYDAAMRGELARAYRALREQPARWRQSAEVVDALVRLGGVELLEEAAAVVEQSTSPDRLQHLARIADQTQDASLLALLAAYFWDASLVILERSGGAATPAQLPPGGPRNIAERAQQKARELGQRAQQLDPTVAQRSPFLAFLGGGAYASGRPAQWSSFDPNAPRTRAQPREPNTRYGWFPVLWGGYVHDLLAEVQGHGFQLGAFFPFVITGDRSSKVRLGFGAGLGFEFVTHDGDYYDDPYDTIDIHGLLGLTLRLGGPRGALFLQAAWAPAARHGCHDCYGEPWEPAPLSFRFAIGPTFGRFQVAFSARVVDVAFAYGDRALLFLPGAQMGVTF